MFEVGDCIIYGHSGVCKVQDIGTVDVGEFSTEKLYYTLIPMYSKGNKIYTPVDNDKVVMRPVISETEARAIIDDMKNIETIEIPDEKRIELVYKEAMKKCDCYELIKVIKTAYMRKQSRIAGGKKVATCDEKYLKMAQDSLYDELALSLQMDKHKIEDFIVDRIESLDIT